MTRSLLLLPALLAGCAIPASDPVLTPRAVTDLGLSGPSAPVDATWWTMLGDAQLDRIVADALAGNPSLDAALARVRQAQATLASRDADAGPDLSFDGSAQIARLSGRYTIPPPFGGSTRFVGMAQANLAYNLDLFGRQKAAIEGARAGLTAVRYDADAARLMLAASVVQTYVELARAERQAKIAHDAIRTREGSLRLTQVRVRNKLASRLDTEAATTLLAQAQQAQVRAEGGRAVAAIALAALVGRGTDYPATIAATRLNLSAPLLLPATIPADLLARRADIAAAQARIAVAAAGRQVARRSFYPNVNLSALAGLQAIGIGNLLNLDAGTAGAGAAVHLPIFDNGRLRADLVGATAALDLSIAEYNDAVVRAVRDAADALARIGNIDAQRVRQREVVRGFAETGRLNAIRVSSGLESRLGLVDTDVRLLDAQLADANLSFDALVARAQLVLALGGGFDPDRDARR